MVVLVSVLASDVLEGIEELIPSFSGVKFSGVDLMDLGQCVSYSQPRWSVLYGVDEVRPPPPRPPICFGPSVCAIVAPTAKLYFVTPTLSKTHLSFLLSNS